MSLGLLSNLGKAEAERNRQLAQQMPQFQIQPQPQLPTIASVFGR